NLVVYPKNMHKNMNLLGGLIYSQRVLLALTQKGASREEAYMLVQRNAMPVWRGEGQFLDLLKKDTEIGRYVSEEELTDLFTLTPYFAQVDMIFARVFGAAD